MVDSIADMITRIRNASAVGKNEVVLPMSKVKFAVAKILEEEGWVGKTEVVKGNSSKDKKDGGYIFDQLKIVLRYKKSGRPAISCLKRVSKPGLRVYAKKDRLPRVLNNLGIAIISTPQGIMTNKEARKKGIGGEVLCEIY
ncbi:MAG: 30S ribosomal protein S8 [Patescibacteria group bacterium]|nr:30S ribosomal protein S8 [Patescibacteria group bacterium]